MLVTEFINYYNNKNYVYFGMLYGPAGRCL